MYLFPGSRISKVDLENIGWPFSYRKWPLIRSLPKPFLQTLTRYNMTPGRNMTLQCHRPDSILEDVMFIPQKISTRRPMQHQKLERKWVDVSLRKMTLSNTGNHSCVCHQTRTPFLALHPRNCGFPRFYIEEL